MDDQEHAGAEQGHGGREHGIPVVGAQVPGRERLHRPSHEGDHDGDERRRGARLEEQGHLEPAGL